MLGYFLISGIAYLCAKRIAERWMGAWKVITGHFAAFLFAWLCCGILGMLLAIALSAPISHNAVPVFFARGFWWAFLGMLFGIYKGKKARKLAISQAQ